MYVRNNLGLWSLFLLLLLVNVLVWAYVRQDRAVWQNVPASPSSAGLRLSALGDEQLAYRLSGMAVQYFGDLGGRRTALNNYDYENLSKWLYSVSALDKRSHYMPFMASYYYGATTDPQKIRPLITYLHYTGMQDGRHKWRWLAQAVFLAKYHAKDLGLAFRLAQDLSSLAKIYDLPVWAVNMPALLLRDMGENEAAYLFMVETLKAQAETLHPNEVIFMRDFICRNLLPEENAAKHPLCQNLYIGG